MGERVVSVQPCFFGSRVFVQPKGQKIPDWAKNKERNQGWASGKDKKVRVRPQWAAFNMKKTLVIPTNGKGPNGSSASTVWTVTFPLSHPHTPVP